MEKKSVELHRYLSLIMLMLLIIRKVSSILFLAACLLIFRGTEIRKGS